MYLIVKYFFFLIGRKHNNNVFPKCSSIFFLLQALVNKEVIGAVVCKLDMHKKGTIRGYIAMLAVDQRYRKRKIGKYPMVFNSRKKSRCLIT